MEFFRDSHLLLAWFVSHAFFLYGPVQIKIYQFQLQYNLLQNSHATVHWELHTMTTRRTLLYLQGLWQHQIGDYIGLRTACRKGGGGLVCFFVVNDAFSVGYYIESKGSTIRERWIGKDLEGSGSGLNRGTILQFDGRTENTTKKLSQVSRSPGRDLNASLSMCA
jgi:hypothetical protein